MRKSSQLQIRVSPAEKAAIKRAARRAELDVSAYVLGRVLPPRAAEFAERVRAVRTSGGAAHEYAALADLLEGLSREELASALTEPPPLRGASPEEENYLAAMVETAAHRKRLPPPAWTRSIPPLEHPSFATDLESVRLALLIASPPAFRRRNVFVDASLGDRI